MTRRNFLTTALGAATGLFFVNQTSAVKPESVGDVKAGGDSLATVPDTSGWTYLPPDPGLRKLSDYEAGLLEKRIGRDLKIRVHAQESIRLIKVTDLTHPLILSTFYYGADGWHARISDRIEPGQPFASNQCGKVPRWEVPVAAP